MKRLFILFFITGLLFVSAGCGKTDDANVVIGFEGGRITSEDLMAHGKRMKKMRQFKNAALESEDIVQHCLNMEMIIAEGLKRNLHLDPNIRAELHAHMSDVFLKFLSTELVPQIKRESVTDEDVKEYFVEHKDNYQKKNKYLFYLIKTGSDKDYGEIESLLSHESPLAEISKKYQTKREGPASMDSIRPVIGDHLKNLEPGKVCGPVNYNGENVVIYLDRIIEPRPFDFEKRKEYIRNDVLYARYRSEWQSVYDSLKRENKVNFVHENLEKFKTEYKGGKYEN